MSVMDLRVDVAEAQQERFTRIILTITHIQKARGITILKQSLLYVLIVIQINTQKAKVAKLM
jgi:hypothetical protein